MKSIKRFCVIGAVVTVILGVISHFVYEWSGRNFFVGLFFPVNESTWEHMKLVFFPMFGYALLAGKRMEEQCPGIYQAMFFGILTGLALIPVLFYTYTGVLGFNVAWVNIALYVVSMLAAYAVVYKKAVNCRETRVRALRYVMYFLLVGFMFFSVYPPRLGLFISPV